jgi:nucleotide-binding universal stress UspA family protein
MNDELAVVVGVDASAGAAAVIRAGAWEAEQRGAPLVLAHGYEDSLTYSAFGMEPYFPPGFDPMAGATEMVDELARKARDRYPGLTVQTRLWVGAGAGGLVEESRRARLLVVGARGSGGFAGLAIGSVATQVASHAHSPVLVVRTAADATDGPVPHPGSVVVGIDGSPTSDQALAFGFEEASLRGVPLVALNSWWHLPRMNLDPLDVNEYGEVEALQDARRLLSEAVAGWSGTYPDVAFEPRSVRGTSPSAALIEASQDAGLVVVGSRGRGGFAGLLLGSVGRDLIGNAHCPVAVVRPA